MCVAFIENSGGHIAEPISHVIPLTSNEVIIDAMLETT